MARRTPRRPVRTGRNTEVSIDVPEPEVGPPVFSHGIILGQGEGEDDLAVPEVGTEDDDEQQHVTTISGTVPDDGQAPATPTGVYTAKNNALEVIIGWDANAEVDMVNGYGKYVVETYLDGIGPVAESNVSATFLVSSVPIGLDAKFRVKAVDAHGNESAWSAYTALVAIDLVDTTSIEDDAITTPKLTANAVTAAKIASLVMEVGKYIQSNAYDGTDVTTGDATQGWRVEAGGLAEFLDVVARGTFKTAQSGKRVELDDDSLEFFSGDAEETAAGQLEVSAITSSAEQIGKLRLWTPNMGQGVAGLSAYSASDASAEEGTVALFTEDEFLEVLNDPGLVRLSTRLEQRYPGATIEDISGTASNSTWWTKNWTSSHVIDDEWGFLDEANDRFVVPTGFGDDQYYEVKVFQSFDANSTGRRKLRIDVNGITLVLDNEFSPSSVDHTMLSFAYEVKMDEGDYVKFNAWQNSGGNLSMPFSRMTIRHLGSVYSPSAAQTH